MLYVTQIHWKLREELLVPEIMNDMLTIVRLLKSGDEGQSREEEEEWVRIGL